MDETLMDLVSKTTGLETERVEKVVKNWVMQTGRSPESLSLEELRFVLVDLIQSLFTEVASGEHPEIKLKGSASQQ